MNSKSILIVLIAAIAYTCVAFDTTRLRYFAEKVYKHLLVDFFLDFNLFVFLAARWFSVAVRRSIGLLKLKI